MSFNFKKIATRAVMTVGTIIGGSSTAAQAQIYNYRTDVQATTPTLQLGANTTSIEVMLTVSIDPYADDGSLLPPLPPQMAALVLASGPENGGFVGDSPDICTLVMPLEYVCNFTMPITATDRAKQTLEIEPEFLFREIIGGKDYTNMLTPLSKSPIVFTRGGCPGEPNPMLPTNTAGGTFTFTIPPASMCSGVFFIDPPVATGYDYSITGSQFYAVTMPSSQTVPDSDGYIVTVPGTNWVPVRAQPGQRVQFPDIFTEFRIRDIDPVLQLDPSNEMAFALGVELAEPTGTITITQTADISDYTPPGGYGPPSTGLMGDEISVRMMNYAPSTRNATVTNAAEFLNFESRFNIDVDYARIRITLEPTPGGASYGNLYSLNFTGLNPVLNTCPNDTIITGAIVTTSKSDAPFTINGTTFTEDSLSVPFAPFQQVYNWADTDWVEVVLGYGCRENTQMNPMGGELKPNPEVLRAPVRRPEIRRQAPRPTREAPSVKGKQSAQPR